MGSLAQGQLLMLEYQLMFSCKMVVFIYFHSLLNFLQVYNILGYQYLFYSIYGRFNLALSDWLYF